jgi:hypothetical protein
VLTRSKLTAIASWPFACLLALATCSSDPALHSGTPASDPLPSTMEARATPSPPDTGLTDVFVATQVGYSGNSVLVTLKLGAAISPTKAPDVVNGSVAKATCFDTVNNDHDLIIPFELEMRNLNASLSLPSNFATIYWLVFLGQRVPATERVSAVEFFGNGPSCRQIDPISTRVPANLFSLRLTEDLAVGRAIHVGGYVLLAGVVQPNFPAGDPDFLRHTFLTPQQQANGAATTFGSGAWEPMSPPIGDITGGIPLVR